MSVCVAVCECLCGEVPRHPFRTSHPPFPHAIWGAAHDLDLGIIALLLREVSRVGVVELARLARFATRYD